MKLKEVWKDIKEYEGYYEVSNLGNVRSKERYVKTGGGGKRLISSKIKNPFLNKRGYLRVQLFKNNRKKNFRVHRLVAQAFIENPENKLEINHKNLNKKDNIVSNLEWVTGEENRLHYDALNK